MRKIDEDRLSITGEDLQESILAVIRAVNRGHPEGGEVGSLNQEVVDVGRVPAFR